jgi:hypothetical protein
MIKGLMFVLMPCLPIAQRVPASKAGGSSEQGTILTASRWMDLRHRSTTGTRPGGEKPIRQGGRGWRENLAHTQDRVRADEGRHA